MPAIIKTPSILDSKKVLWITLLTMKASLLLTSGYALGHSGPLNKVAVNACTDKRKSDDCQYQGHHDDLYIGTCQYMATTLMCVRNQPIQKIEIKEKESEVKPVHKHESDS